MEDGLRLSRALDRERRQQNPKYAELCRRYLADEKDFSEKNLAVLNIAGRYKNEDLETCISNIVSDITDTEC